MEQTVIALAPQFLAVLTGVRLNNNRLNDVQELMGAKIGRSQAQLQLLIEKNRSEIRLKFAEIDGRLTRIENERRIIQ